MRKDLIYPAALAALSWSAVGLSFFEPKLGLIVGMSVVSWALYLIPTAIALGRDHRKAGVIAALNVFAGWTVVGLVVALLWAISSEKSQEQGTLASTV